MNRRPLPLLLLPVLIGCNNTPTEAASPEPAPTQLATAAPVAVATPRTTAAASVAPVSSSATTAEPIALKRAALAIKGMR